MSYDESIAGRVRTALPLCQERCRIRTGYGPENVTRLRRFAIGLIKSQGAKSVAQKMRHLNKNTRLVFDYLRMTANSCAARTT
jgi:hypothetical protein